MLMYAQDYDEMMVRYYDNDYGWVEKVQSYAKNPQMFLCPSKSGGGWACTSPAHAPETGQAARFGRIGYGMNIMRLPYSGGAWYGIYGHEALAQWVAPAESIMVGDSSCPRLRAEDYINWFNQGGVSYVPHNGGANLCYMDGHAKWVNKVKQADFTYNQSRPLTTAP